MEFVKKWDACQRHANFYGLPAERLHLLSSPWLFHKWGIDMLGLLSIGMCQLKYLIVETNYFSKWVEAKPVAKISVEKGKEVLMEIYPM